MGMLGKFKEFRQKSKELYNAPKGESQDLLKEAVRIANARETTYSFTAPNPTHDAMDQARDRALDTFFPIEYRNELSGKGITVGSRISNRKIQLVATISKPSRTRPEITKGAYREQEINIIVDGRKDGHCEIIVAQGAMEYPIKEYPLPATFEKARQKIREIIEEER